MPSRFYNAQLVVDQLKSKSLTGKLRTTLNIININDADFTLIIGALESIKHRATITFNVGKNQLTDQAIIFLAECMSSGKLPQDLKLNFHFTSHTFGFYAFVALGNALQTEKCPANLTFDFKDLDISSYAVNAFIASYEDYQRQHNAQTPATAAFLDSHAATLTTKQLQPKAGLTEEDLEVLKQTALARP